MNKLTQSGDVLTTDDKQILRQIRRVKPNARVQWKNRLFWNKFSFNIMDQVGLFWAIPVQIAYSTWIPPEPLENNKNLPELQ